jgi:hypothetical protein
MNERIDPIPNLEVLKIIKSTLHLPWYEEYSITESWGFFFAFGVNNFQVKTLWVEFLVIIACFLYLDNFCYSIYESAGFKNNINYYILREKSSVKKSLLNLSEEEYEEMRSNLKIDFDINLIPLYELKEKILGKHESIQGVNEEINKHNSNNNKINSYDNLIASNLRTSSNMDNKSIYTQFVKSQRNKKSKLRIFFNWMKRTLYLTMHNLILVITLILSMLNTGLISAFYIIFSLYYLYNSNNIVLSKPYSFPKKIDKFLRNFFNYYYVYEIYS